MGSIEGRDTLLSGQAQVWRLMYASADAMALKCAVELGIPDIIHSHGRPISLSKIASGINSKNLNLDYLERVMGYLVRKRVFCTTHQHQKLETQTQTLYGLTSISKWLVRDTDLSLNNMVKMHTHPWILSPWSCIAQCVRDDGVAFTKYHGVEMWDFASQNPEFNSLFNDAMACTSKIVMTALLSKYKGFDSVKTLVDVGGGIGQVLSQIVKAYPHINGINFDLPHVIETAPNYVGISHVGGSMFDAIPNADAILMKWILHDWKDEECVKILRNCGKALPKKTGKLIIVEIVVQSDGDTIFGDMDLVFDMAMLAGPSGGKERTELEWKELLEEGGFPCYNIIKIPAMLSIIEAYAE
ncbi:(R,S)-reticuline 7-O-methyltransferase-like [Tripterygium wilfordii]|uniref:(R,S)-reticuline 7-O-methyltransferase-like n=1 Tax=Tripterygium wilfordii TaxID=458696 RepID=UPI0018F85A21|nr:(R,S)-reticuline 7-O-methyltransferase-like [Tripterygium wilfordii]